MVRPGWGSTRAHSRDPTARLSQDEHHHRQCRGRRDVAAGRIQATTRQLLGRPNQTLGDAYTWSLSILLYSGAMRTKRGSECANVRPAHPTIVLFTAVQLCVTLGLT